MDSTTELEHLIALAAAIAGERRPEGVIDAALPALLSIGGADAGVVLLETRDGPRVTAQAGRELDLEAAVELTELLDGGETTLGTHPAPAAWEAQGISRVASRRLPGQAGVLLLAWGAVAGEPPAALELALTTLEANLARAQSEEGLADLTTRVDHAQSLANMGDYDWHIATDVNTWSDQLFRIYGHEPQSFHPSYDTFLSLIHPDDRERISGVHQQAYATGEPYQMIERIVRPDGEVRYLSSNGEVIMDAHSQPVRMRGTCIDITERVLIDQARPTRSSCWTRSTASSTPTGAHATCWAETRRGTTSSRSCLVGRTPGPSVSTAPASTDSH